MKIKCKKCGFENQMGAIFCRQCGEKINMDDISPESLESGKKKKAGGSAGGKFAKGIFLLLFLLIVFAVIGAGTAAFAPWELPIYTAPGADDKPDDFKLKEKRALARLEKYSSEEGTRVSPGILSFEELNILYDKHFLKSKEVGGDHWKLEHVYFIPDEDTITIRFFVKLFDRVPAVFQVRGMPKIKEEGSGEVTFPVKTAVVGRLPLLYCSKLVGEKVEDFFNKNDDMKRIFQNTKSLSIDGDVLLFSFHRKKQPAVEPPVMKEENVEKAEKAEKAEKTEKTEKAAGKTSKKKKARKTGEKKKSGKN